MEIETQMRSTFVTRFWVGALDGGVVLWFQQPVIWGSAVERNC